MKTHLKIGIVGFGMVGGAVYKYFEKLGNPIFRKDLDIDENVNQADIIFIAVPTPYDEKLNGYDLETVRSSLAALEEGKLVVLKSTIQPGTTQMLQDEFPKLKLLFNPEFLTEHTADNDFEKPDRQIVGYTEQSQDDAHMVMELLPDAPYKKVLRAQEAEMIKLATNAYMSMKVVYFNQIFDICEKNGIDYDSVREGVNSDWRIGNSHSDVWHGGFRGFAGKCLPKDMNALIAFAEKSGDGELFKKVREINETLVTSTKDLTERR